MRLYTTYEEWKASLHQVVLDHFCTRKSVVASLTFKEMTDKVKVAKVLDGVQRILSTQDRVTIEFCTLGPDDGEEEGACDWVATLSLPQDEANAILQQEWQRYQAWTQKQSWGYDNI